MLEQINIFLCLESFNKINDLSYSKENYKILAKIFEHNFFNPVYPYII